VSAFRFRLVLEDGSPAEPPTFAAAVPDWHPRQVFFTSPGHYFRILRIEPELDGSADHDATWIVEPVRLT
jgi:hypothetical protein